MDEFVVFPSDLDQQPKGWFSVISSHLELDPFNWLLLPAPSGRDLRISMSDSEGNLHISYSVPLYATIDMRLMDLLTLRIMLCQGNVSFKKNQ
uniref:Uncharacterized protein n=1 Tax=Timema poppense TaxID=170557 RepID=A0A7R9HBD8_TIMPO|nr:unnamed protein product [Timema poppensis]